MKKINAQSWLDEMPNEDKLKVRVIGRKPPEQTENFWELKSDEALEGELKIDGFPELRLVSLQVELESRDEGSLTKVTINNCPKLENVNLRNNKISELDVSGLSNLLYLLVTHNEWGEINVKGCVKLQWVMAFGNKKSTKQEWKGLEDLKSLVKINTNDPFFPAEEFKNWKKITDSTKGLDILNSEGVIDDNKLKEYKEWNNKFPGKTAEKVTQRISAWDSLAERMVKKLEGINEKHWRNEYEACRKQAG